MQTDSKYFSIAVALVLVCAGLLWLGGNNGLTVQEIFALFLILAFASMFPLAGFIFLIPVTLILFIKHGKSFWNWFGALGGVSLNTKTAQNPAFIPSNQTSETQTFPYTNNQQNQTYFSNLP